jgi:hypothetical protein
LLKTMNHQRWYLAVSQAWERKSQHGWSKSSVLPYTCISSRGSGHVVLDALHLHVLEPFYACTCTHWRPACVCTHPKLVMFVHMPASIKRSPCFASFSDECASAFVELHLVLRARVFFMIYRW